MSRVSLIEQLYVKRKSALEFNYDALWAPPIRSILTQEDINELYQIATSLRYNGDIEKKYELIDTIMRSRGFRKAHCGTNRVVYNFLEIPTFVAKIAIDKVGMKDSPAEYRNQEFFKPFCCKIFEVDPTGVIAFVERVNPITSLEEFLSVADDVFNLMITKIIGKYVVDDLGTEKFMNYGLRYNSNGYTFGPVIIDFPYAYELDGAKMICKNTVNTPFGKSVCNGEIDYDEGLNHLICTKCGKVYSAQDLKKQGSTIKMVFDSDKKGELIAMRAKIMSGDKVIMDSGYSSSTHVTKEQWEAATASNQNPNHEPRRVSRHKKTRYKEVKDYRREYYTSLQVEQYNRMQNQGLFNPVIPENKRIVTKDYYVDGPLDNQEDNYTIGTYNTPKARITTIDEIDRPKIPVKTEVIDENKIEDEKVDLLEDDETTSSEEKDHQHMPMQELFIDTIKEDEGGNTGMGSIIDQSKEYFILPKKEEDIIPEFNMETHRKQKEALKQQQNADNSSTSEVPDAEENTSYSSSVYRYDDIKTQANGYLNNYDEDDDFNKRRNRNHRNKKSNKYKNGGKKDRGFNDPNSGMDKF